MFLTKMKIAIVFLLFLAAMGAASLLLHDTLTARAPAFDQHPQAAPLGPPVNPNANAGGKGDPKPRILDPEGVVFRIAWSRDGTAIASISHTQDMEERVIGGKKSPVYSFNGTVKFWDVSQGKLKVSMGEEKKIRIEAVAFSPDGKLAAIAAMTGNPGRNDPFEIRLVDPQAGAVKKAIKQEIIVKAAVFSPDGKTLAIGGQYLPTDLNGPFHRTVRLWDVEKGKVTKEFKQELEAAKLMETGYLDGLRDLAFSRDGKLLASADADWKVRVVDVATGKLHQTLDGHASAVLAVAFAPDGKTLVSGSADHTVRVWDVATGKELRKQLEHKSMVRAVAYSPDGKIVATGASEVILWDASSWQQKKTFPAEKNAVTALSFSPGDGNTLAVGTDRIRLWRMREVLAGNK